MRTVSPKSPVVVFANLVVLAALLLAACGGDVGETASTSGAVAQPAPTTLPAAPTTLPAAPTTLPAAPTTLPPSTNDSPAGTSAVPTVTPIALDYRCGEGEAGSTEIRAGNLEQVDDVVNTLDLCEFRGGLIEISLVAECPSGDRPVSVPAADGGLPDFATLDLCEATG